MIIDRCAITKVKNPAPADHIRKRARANTNEFVLCLSVFFLLIVVPLIDLLGLASGLATLCLLTHQAVSKASVQNRHSKALSALESEADAITDSGFGRFARLVPIEGYRNCGVDLFVTATNCKDQSTQTSNANQLLSGLIDPSTYVYEYTARSVFDVGPIVSLKAIPMLDQVPGLGRPATVSFSANRVIEHLDAISPERGRKAGRGSKLSLNPDSQSGNGNGGVSNVGGWNYPNLYQMIADAGQTVVDEDVLQVFANNPNWTVTDLNVQPGDKIWIDYRADGLWTRTDGTITDYSVPFFNADGDAKYRPHDFPAASMVGRMGNGEAFFLGSRQWNFAPPQYGNLQLIFNCGHLPLGSTANAANYTDNRGSMTVRVVIAR